ncbi:MAG: polysaccharide deacetylase family protein, partial [Rubrivivax sp.]
PILRDAGLPATFFVATGFLDGGRMWNDTLIETIRACRLPAVDLEGTPAARLGRLELGSSPESRRQEIDRVLKGIKYLDQEQRLACVNAIAERAETDLPSDLMMSSAQVRALHSLGMQIGAHTVNHPILAGLPDEQARAEIADSRRALQEITGAPVSLFAYPNGKPGTDYTERSTQIVRELGFEAAVSTHWGAAKQGDDYFQIPRFTPWDRSRWRFSARLQRNLLLSRRANV